MTLDRFVSERKPRWDELELLLERSPGRRGLDAAEVLRLGALYRATAADLAFARRRFSGERVVVDLERRVAEARLAVYGGRRRRRGGVVRFFVRDYWRIVAERPWALLAAALLVFVPALLAAAWALSDPAAATGIVPAEFRSATETPRPWTHFSPGEQSAFSAAVLTNNIKVTFLAFAGGITGGVLTTLSLLFNGLLLGVIAGLMIGAGNGTGFVDLVTAHGVLELSCIVVGGAAGLRLGWSIIAPGLLTRRESISREAQRAVLLVLGTAPWLVVAGIIEGFRAQLATAGLGVVIGVGVAVGGLYWALVLLLGSERGARLRAQVRADAGDGEARRSRLDDLGAGAA